MQRLLNNSLGLIFLALLLSGCSMSPKPAPTAAETLVPGKVASRYEQALSSARDGDSNGAIQRLELFTTEYPEYPGAFLTLAQLRMQAQQNDAAIATLEQCLILHPGYAPAHNQLGVVFREQGEFDRAAAAYESAIRVNPDYALAYLNLGVLNDLYRQQPQMALDSYQQYRQRLPAGADDAEVDRWIADLQRRTGTEQDTGSEQ